MIHEVTELGGAAAAEAAGVRHVTHGYGPTLPGTDVFAGVIGETLATAGLPDPIPAVLSGAYLDICPPRCSCAAGPWRRPASAAPDCG